MPLDPYDGDAHGVLAGPVLVEPLGGVGVTPVEHGGAEAETPVDADRLGPGRHLEPQMPGGVGEAHRAVEIAEHGEQAAAAEGSDPTQ